MIRMTAALLSGLLLLTPVLASTDKDKPLPKDKGDKKEESLSFSNSDLERRYGGGEEKAKSKKAAPSSAVEKKSEAGSSALEKMFAKEEAKKERAQKVADAEEVVAAAKERIARLEKTKRAIANPYLARPSAPEDEEQAERWKNQDSAERLNSTDAELKSARKMLADAQAALAEARRN